MSLNLGPDPDPRCVLAIRDLIASLRKNAATKTDAELVWGRFPFGGLACNPWMMEPDAGQRVRAGDLAWADSLEKDLNEEVGDEPLIVEEGHAADLRATL